VPNKSDKDEAGGGTHVDSVSSSSIMNNNSDSTATAALSSASMRPRTQKVLLLGAGLVAAPLVDYLTAAPRGSSGGEGGGDISSRRHVTVVADNKAAAQALAARAPGSASAVELAVQPGKVLDHKNKENFFESWGRTV